LGVDPIGFDLQISAALNSFVRTILAILKAKLKGEEDHARRCKRNTKPESMVQIWDLIARQHDTGTRCYGEGKPKARERSLLTRISVRCR
jgi:hypothetical protein